MTQERKAKPTRGRPSRRPQILAATNKLLRTQGLSSVTTRAIAAEAGCSEAALYVHFKSRLNLLLAVLEESLPDLLLPLRQLEQAVGKNTVERNLQGALRAITEFHQHVIPVVCALFAEPDLLAAYRESLNSAGKGPHRSISRLSDYLRAEQQLGRIRSDLNAGATARILMSSCFFRSFTGQFFGKAEPFDAFAKGLLAAIF
jgi:AcrR family transcriptional regulator